MAQSFLLLSNTQLELMCILFPTPQNPSNIVPDTQDISASNSASNDPEEDFIDVDTIPETQNTGTFSHATGKYLDNSYTMYNNYLA